LKADIILKWSENKQDIEVFWKEGSRGMAFYILTSLGSSQHSEFRKELESAGYDLTTLKLSISKKKTESLL
jgi:hypothetical protein